MVKKFFLILLFLLPLAFGCTSTTVLNINQDSICYIYDEGSIDSKGNAGLNSLAFTLHNQLPEIEKFSLRANEKPKIVIKNHRAKLTVIAFGKGVYNAFDIFEQADCNLILLDPVTRVNAEKFQLEKNINLLLILVNPDLDLNRPFIQGSANHYGDLRNKTIAHEDIPNDPGVKLIIFDTLNFLHQPEPEIVDPKKYGKSANLLK